MSEKYKKTYRGYLIDHHSPAPPTVTFDKLSPEEYEKFYLEAGINNLMVYTKDHWGYSYYDTKIGTKHPGLKYDYIQSVSDILKKHNIEFNAYYCLEYDTLAPAQHPEWATRDPEGNIVALRGRMAKWGMPCYETGYREYVLGQLAEVVSMYHPDSLFLDIFGKTLCYCDACKAKFKAKYGYDLPVGEGRPEYETVTLDFGEKGRDVNHFLEDCEQEMLADIMKTVKDIDPEIKVTINFAALYPKKIRDMLDYQFTEPWAGNWLSAAYSRDTAKGQYPQLGPGDVSEVYNYRHNAVYDLAAAQIAAQGCRVFMYSGSQHVDGTLEHTEAQKVGHAYAENIQFESYLDDRTVSADIAILQSDLSSMAKSGTDVVMYSIGRCKRSDAHREAILGAMKLCDGSKYSWRILPEQEATLEELKKHKLVVMAGMYHVSEELKVALEAFKAQGGKIIADGECGLYEPDGTLLADFAAPGLTGCHYERLIDEYASAAWGGYIQCEEDAIWKYTPETMPPMGSVQYGVKADGKVLGYIIPPCTPLTETQWVNWWCPPPALEASAYPAVVEGDGTIYFAFDFFRSVESGLNLLQGIMNGALEKLIPQPTMKLRTETPEAIGYVAYDRAEDTVVHVVSHLAEKLNGEPPVIKTGVLELGYEAKSAKLVYPCEKELEILKTEAGCEIALPDIYIHEVLVIQ